MGVAGAEECIFTVQLLYTAHQKGLLNVLAFQGAVQLSSLYLD